MRRARANECICWLYRCVRNDGGVVLWRPLQSSHSLGRAVRHRPRVAEAAITLRATTKASASVKATRRPVRRPPRREIGPAASGRGRRPTPPHSDAAAAVMEGDDDIAPPSDAAAVVVVDVLPTAEPLLRVGAASLARAVTDTIAGQVESECGCAWAGGSCACYAHTPRSQPRAQRRRASCDRWSA